MTPAQGWRPPAHGLQAASHPHPLARPLVGQAHCQVAPPWHSGTEGEEQEFTRSLHTSS